MDKTTTWLIRGASLIIIVFGSIAFKDYLQAKRTLNEVKEATKEYLKQQEENNPKKYIFNSKSEAEEEARKLGCTGAHKMGNKWMPCSIHK